MKIKISDAVEVDYSITTNETTTIYKIEKVIKNGENWNTDKQFNTLEELKKYYEKYDWEALYESFK